MYRLRLLLCLLALGYVSALPLWGQTPQLDDLYEEAEKAATGKDLPRAYALAEEFVASCPASAGGFHLSKMVELLSQKARSEGDQARAIALAKQVIALREGDAKCAPLHKANARNELAILYAQMGNHDEAIAEEEQALAIYEKHVSPRTPQYAIARQNMAVFLAARGDKNDALRALKLSEESLKYIKRGTRDYANAQCNLVVYYALTGSLTEAEKLARRALKEGRKSYGKQSADYATMLANTAVRLSAMRAYKQAQQYAEEANSVFHDNGLTNGLPYARFLVNYGAVCTYLERYDKSIELLNEALPLLKQLVGTAHTDYVRCLSELSLAHNNAGHAEEAERYGAQLSGEVGDATSHNVKYARTLSKQATLLTTAGAYTQALAIEQKACRIYTQKGTASDHAASLTRLADIYIRQGEYATAVDSLVAAKRLVEGKGKKKEDEVHGEIHGFLAMAHFYQKDYAAALDEINQQVDIIRQTGDTLSSFYAKALGNQALIMQQNGQKDQALTTAQKGCELLAATLGKDHPDNVPALYNLAIINSGNGNSDATQLYCHQALELQGDLLRSNFSHLTSAEREVYWNRKSYPYKVMPTLAFLHEDNEALMKDAYNAQLFTKGLLLNSEINFHDFLVATGDSTLLATYEALTLLRGDIDAMYNLPAQERGNRLESLKKEAAAKEKELVRSCKAYGNFMESLLADYTKVRAALRPNEMAIEIMNLEVKGQGDTYAALCLRHNWDAPRLKVLFSRRDLQELDFNGKNFFQTAHSREGISRIYNDPRVGKLFWGNLLDETKGVQHLYFAPSGMFHQIGAEYLQIDSLQKLSERFATHRLSSTRLLVDRKNRPAQYHAASVFGGLHYDMNLNELQAAHEQFKNYEIEQPLDLYASRALAADSLTVDSLLDRGAVHYLPGTLAEAEYIGEQLMQHEVPTNMFLGTEGTEEAFKALSGKHQNLIHIATHGFYFTDTQTQAPGASFLQLQEDAGGTPLSRCGLLLSGANCTLRGARIPRNIENGILTAREISLLDLSTADLIVLSACQTAQGEVRDDGVFGLQRGFKKAGAHTLLMSLWNVNDAATMTMMNAFYTALMNGKEKHAAFNEAQASVRAAGFTAPFFWASFIMLDDI